MSNKRVGNSGQPLENKILTIWVLSAMVPATMEESAQAKANWKNQLCNSMSPLARKNPVFPTNVLSPASSPP